MKTRTLVGTLGLAAILLWSSLGYSVAVAPVPPPSKLAQFSSHISHIIFMMQENRAFDNFYGSYCPSTSTYCPNAVNGIPVGTCVPLYPGTTNHLCHRPYPISARWLSTPDLPHDWYATHTAYDHGKMDNFFVAEYGNQTFGHYNGTTIPVYWDLAEQYGLADNFFSSAMSYSLSNHWYMVGSSAPKVGELQFPPWASVNIQHQYLNQSNKTPTLEDRLINSTVSWNYYDFSLSLYKSAINNYGCCGGGGAYDFWQPLATRHQSYAPTVRTHFAPQSQFFTDAANGNLPNISWMIPTAWQSDHAPSNLTDGQNWSASVVNALENSPEWNSTVLFITWDEYGGWYDHVAPPHLDGIGDSLRVPLLAISPWVKQGIVDHTQMDFGSVLHLMEQRFGLQCLGGRDCNASLPLGLFDFGHGPRAPITIAPYGTASYPMPLQSSGLVPRFNPGLAAPPVFAVPRSVSGFISGSED